MDSNRMAINENLFKLQCLIKATEIQHSAQCRLGGTLFLALATSSADIIFYYKRESSSLPVIKRIPWFQAPHKHIASLCFDPCGVWLLCITFDGSMYIIPALILISDNHIIDERWKTNDVTYIPFITPQLPHFRPTTITWWKNTKLSIDIGIIGTECGAVILVNLSNGQQVGIAYINESVNSLYVCQNENNESTSLLITSKAQQQWRLFLEQYTYNFLHNLENKESHDDINSTYNNAEGSTPCKSKLQELKQLSVEKLAILKQKLIETKKHQTLREAPQCHDMANNKKTGNGILVNSETLLDCKSNFINPEPIPKDTFLSSQYDMEGQQLYTCYHPITNHITIHGPDLGMVPLSIHKIFQSCGTVLLAHKFFFVTDISQCVMYIISDQLSETHINEDCEFNSESIVGAFSFKSSKEVIRAMYKVTKFDNVVSKKASQEIESKCTFAKTVNDVKIEIPSLDVCVIVTNHCVYEVILRKSLLSVFMELVLKKNELEKAGKLATIFGLNGQHLLEYAGDIYLSNKEFSHAIAFYKMSKCKLLKSVLKFASVGLTSELLSCLTHCLLTPAVEISVATRIHLSNLCVLAFIEMILRVWTEQSKAIYKEFLYFLSTNTFYDELLAINIAGQTYLWEVLHHLATQRNLYGQMLDILMKTVQTLDTNDSHPKSYGLLICLSEPGLMQAMLLNHDLARSHMLCVRSNLCDSHIFVLQRLVTLYDPTNPVLRARLIQCKKRLRTLSYNLQSSHCDSIDVTDNTDPPDTLVGEIIETFILILLTLIYKRRVLNPDHKPILLYDIELPEINKEHLDVISQIDFKKRILCSGFSHVALIRNANVYTWGSSVQGCLGTGSSVLRYGAPHALCFFRIMGVEIYSVSCGHCHTLAVTNNGIYAWGASQFGQLGLGKVLQCSSPELITLLAQEIIVDAVAGQYHSVALTADGRMFTWGWGVHGQLGHGNTDGKTIPTLVASLLGVVVCYISAGYAHTLALSVDGIVYAFGCNVLGQLGIGVNAKSSIPIKVPLPDGIMLINTAYFHNLAVSNTNKLYIWGASPQVLRLQAQAQKKTRILEQRDANEKKNKTSEEENLEKISGSAMNLDEEMKKLLEDNIETRSAQAEATSDTETQGKPSGNTNLNICLIEEDQAHLKPSVVDTSLVKGQITQISAGCHHNALITKDGSVYTWGRNFDGQIGNGTRREVPIPTPLYYNSACIFAQIPPRRNEFKGMQNQQNLDSNAKLNDSSENNGNVSESNGRTTNGHTSMHAENADINKERINPIINAIGIACGYDYTVVLQAGGTVLAWGNNSRAQLGRIPAKETRDADDKLVLLKSSKRVVRLPHTLHIALDVPSQVPGISTPVISYRTNDLSSLAGLVRLLRVIEKTPGELTLHYVLEHFYGLYSSASIMEKSIELENYQACSKIAALEGNISTAFIYHLKTLHKLSLQSSTNHSMTEVSHEVMDSSENANITNIPASSRHIKKNTELFNRQVEKNLMESLEDSVARNWIKIPTSRSLNNLQALAQELYSFDCQGGLEGLCGDRRNDDLPSHNSDNESNKIKNQQQEEIESFILNENELLSQCKNFPHNVAKNLSQSIRTETMLNINDHQTSHYANDKEKVVFSDKVSSHSQRNCIINETIKVLKFYLNNIISKEVYMNILKCEILQSAIDFWLAHNLPMQTLENVLLEHIQIIYYPLGLLLFCQNGMGRYIDANKYDIEDRNFCINDLFSIKFCLQILSMLLQHINQDETMPEYVKVFSSLMADHYGAPLYGYPGTSGNNNPEQMMEGIINTVFSEMENSRLFAHIKDSDAVYRLLMAEEDNMIFTCGHYFPMSVYNTEIIPTMETELLTSSSLILPRTSQYLGNMLSHTAKPEILCPLCIIEALKATTKKSYE